MLCSLIQLDLRSIEFLMFVGLALILQNYHDMNWIMVDSASCSFAYPFEASICIVGIIGSMQIYV